MSGDLDGLRLDRLKIGEIYDMGISLATYLMSCGFAVPVVDESPARIVLLNQDACDTARSATGVDRSVVSNRSESRHARGDFDRIALLPFSKRESM
jgi:hypothetical protein